MKTRKQTKTLLSAVIVIFLSICIITGQTFAMFTSRDDVDISISSGTVKITAHIDEDSLNLYSKNVVQTDTDVDGKKLFENSGTASFDDDANLVLERVTPGDKAEFNIVITSESNVDILYKVNWDVSGSLADALIATVDGEVLVSNSSAWTEWDITEGYTRTLALSIELPMDVIGENGESYQAQESTIAFSVEAVQANADMPDEWDGTMDASFYFDNPDATEYEINTAEQLAALAALVDGGKIDNQATTFNTDSVEKLEAVTFQDKKVVLTKDIDLYLKGENGEPVSFNPIGHSKNGVSFNGIFDGQGYTIKNMYMQSNLDSNNGGWLYEGEYYGLFAYTVGAEIMNLNIENAYISSGRNEAACVVGNAVDTTFSNINISNSTLIAYNNSAGGVAAECYGECSFSDISVDNETVIGPLWETYDASLGGIVGMVKSSAEVSFSNITVACKIDAINDVASNYQYWLYRYSGMLIGTVDGVNGVADPTGYVTCENVTVIYDDWMNYHYCEFASLGAGSYNGPGEYKFARVEAGTGTGGIDLSTCNHAADESHNVLIVFDQLFGGGQGIRGLRAYEGVTVNYPASYNPDNN